MVVSRWWWPSGSFRGVLIPVLVVFVGCGRMVVMGDVVLHHSMYGELHWSSLYDLGFWLSSLRVRGCYRLHNSTKIVFGGMRPQMVS